MGAGVPHSAPSRRGTSGTATTFRVLSSALQRACASSISVRDQVSTGDVSAGTLPRNSRGQLLVAMSPGCCAGVTGLASVGAAFWANAPGVASTQNTAAVAQPLTLFN